MCSKRNKGFAEWRIAAIAVAVVAIVILTFSGIITWPFLGKMVGGVMCQDCAMISSDTCQVYGVTVSARGTKGFCLYPVRSNKADAWYDPPVDANRCIISGTDEDTGIAVSADVPYDRGACMASLQDFEDWNYDRVGIYNPTVTLYRSAASPEEPPTDPCEGVVCNPLVSTCPDGYVAYCDTYCIPETGQCTTCVPDCSGHDAQPEEEPPVDDTQPEGEPPGEDSTTPPSDEESQDMSWVSALTIILLVGIIALVIYRFVIRS